MSAIARGVEQREITSRERTPRAARALGVRRAGVLLGLFVFAGLALWVVERGASALDQPLYTFSRAHRAPALTDIMRWVSELGRGPAYVAIFAVLAFVLWKRRRRALVYLAASGVGAGVIDVLLKLCFERPRPAAAFRLVAAGGYSFPSGHSMSSAAFYGALAAIALLELRRTRWAAALACIALALAVGVSRVYLCVHYASDVAAGWALGGAWALGLLPLLERSEAERSPGAS